MSTSGARRATLATVAASAGVSVATVSKVLNGRADVAPATRARVQDLLAQHDYVGRRSGPARRSRSVELVFDGELNALRHRDRAGRRWTRRPELGAVVAVAVRGRRRRGADRRSRGPATWSPPAARP